MIVSQVPQLAARRLTVGGTRFYQIDGALYPSVTSILQVIAKPDLVRWARRTTIEAIRQALDGKGGPYSREFLEAVLERAAQEPERVRDAAAGKGSSAHEAVSLALAGEPYDETYAPQVQAALAFLQDQGLKVLATETVVASKAHGFAGTADLLAERDGALVLADWKSGSGVWPEYALQLGAYSLAIQEMMGHPIEHAYVVQLREGGYQAHRVNLEAARPAFLSALALWQGLKAELFQP
jgi:ATP-dependent exoDNAse (exonuclease V) beta subunit